MAFITFQGMTIEPQPVFFFSSMRKFLQISDARVA